MAKTKKKQTKKEKEDKITYALVKQLLELSTAGFGLAAALAWNAAIQSAITQYLKPYIGDSSSVITLFLYAAIVTALAVFITYSLTKLQQKIKDKL